VKALQQIIRRLVENPSRPRALAALRQTDAALRRAKPQSENSFKVELAKRWLVHALTLATQPA
jgi:hypothetical protein